jgi:hypothetical protein
MINPATRVRKFVHHAVCVHDFQQVAVGEIANTETCFKCFTSRFIFHDEPSHTRHLAPVSKRDLKLITDIVRRSR